MSYKPKDFFLGPFEFFSALIPGVIGVLLLWFIFDKSQIHEFILSKPDAVKWIAFAVASLVLGYALHPPSHILNKLYNYTYRAYRRRKGDTYYEFAKEKALEENPNILKTGSVYEWAKEKVEFKEPSLMDRVGMIQGISKLFRSLCLFILIAIILTMLKASWELLSYLLVAFIVFFLVYSERRWHATCYVYRRYWYIKNEEHA